jgi:hypothetical protein
MKALTIIQPWASLIVGSPTAPPQKPIENRSWPPPASMIGEQFAIHAGKKLELEEFEDVFLDKACGECTAPFTTPKTFPLGAVVGVATLDRVVSLQHARDQLCWMGDRFRNINPATRASWRLDEDALRWFFGRVGFVLRDRRHIATPVPCKGALGFWQLPGDVEAAIREQLGAAP